MERDGNGWKCRSKRHFTLVGPTAATKRSVSRDILAVRRRSVIVSEDSVTYLGERTTGAGEGLTIAVRYPADAIAELPWWQVWFDRIIDNVWLLMPILVFFIMYVIGSLRQAGRPRR